MKQPNKNAAAGPAAYWALLCAGADNPIGNVRVKQAHDVVTARNGETERSATMDEVASRAGDFNEYLAHHGLFLAGSSDGQGEWPEILLTQARDGLFYLDHTLDDAAAPAHFIVKLGRGNDASLANILRMKAPYLLLVKQLGLHVHGELTLRERALFIPRLDREVISGRVLRHGQESVASRWGISGFGNVPSHNDACRRLGATATDPTANVIEYIKRDIANIALGNKDNHARNTPIQRRAEGAICLTPLFALHRCGSIPTASPAKSDGKQTMAVRRDGRA